jgi:carbonic anhydrase
VVDPPFLLRMNRSIRKMAMSPRGVVAAALLVALTAAINIGSDWDYGERYRSAPSRWHRIGNGTVFDYPVCSSGQRQSPVNLVRTMADAGLKPLANAWVDSNNFTVSNDGQRLLLVPQDVAAVFTDPHTAARSMLQYISVHAPSGHTVGGAAFDAELNLVHVDDKGAVQAVVAVLLRAGAGHSAVMGLWIDLLQAAPTRASNADPAPAARESIHRLPLLISQMIPLARDYVTYDGSMAYPPCTEGVTHYVFTAPMLISAAQLARVRSMIGLGNNTRLDRNSRPPQPWRDSVRVQRAYKDNRAAFAVFIPAAVEAWTTDTILALSSAVLASVALTLAIGAFIVALCHPRGEDA